MLPNIFQFCTIIVLANKIKIRYVPKGFKEALNPFGTDQFLIWWSKRPEKLTAVMEASRVTTASMQEFQHTLLSLDSYLIGT